MDGRWYVRHEHSIPNSASGVDGLRECVCVSVCTAGCIELGGEYEWPLAYHVAPAIDLESFHWCAGIRVASGREMKTQPLYVNGEKSVFIHLSYFKNMHVLSF